MNGAVKASWWRRTLAGLADAGLVWLVRRRLFGTPAAAASSAWLLEPAATAVREQLGSPGQRLLGVRTVDRRTSRRVAPWRTLALLAVAATGQLLVRRLAPSEPSPEEQHERERFWREVGDVHQRHPLDSDAREAELERLYAQPPTAVQVNMLQVMGPAFAVGLLNAGLRRRLAPTREVLSRAD